MRKRRGQKAKYKEFFRCSTIDQTPGSQLGKSKDPIGISNDSKQEVGLFKILASKNC